MEKGSLYSEPFRILRLPHDTVPIVEKTAHEGQVLGHFSVGSPLEFDSEQLGSRAAYVEAAGFERRTHQFGMAARVPFGRVQVPSGQ